MHPAIRRTGRITGWAIATLLSLLVVAFLALQTPYAKQKILGVLTARTNAALSGEVRVDRLTGSLLWGIELHDVRVRDRHGEPVLRADAIEIGYSLLSLVGEEVDVRSVTVRRPLSTIRRYPEEAEAAFNVTGLMAETAEPTSERRIDVGHLEIVDGEVIYADGATVEDVDLGGSLAYRSAGTSRLDIERVAFTADTVGGGTPVAVKGTGRVSSDTFAFDATASVSAGGVLELEGAGDVRAGSYTVELGGTGLRLGAWLPWTMPETSFDVAATVTGRGLQPRATMVLTDGRVGAYRLDRLALEAAVDVGATSPRVEVSELALESPYLEATGSGHIAQSGEFGVAFDGRTPAGGLPGALAEKWGLDPEELGEADISFEGSGAVDFRKPGTLEKLRRLDLTADWEMGTVAVETATVASSDGNVELRLAPDGDGRDHHDLVLDTAGAFRGLALPDHRLESGTWDGEAGGTIRLDGSGLADGLSTLSGATRFEVEGLTGPGFSAGDAEGRLTVDRENASSPIRYGVDLEANDATYGDYRAGRLAVAASGGLEAFDLTATVTRGSNGLFDVDSLTLSADGSAPETAGDAAGFLEGLTADGHLDVRALRGFGLQMERIATDFEVTEPLEGVIGFVRTTISRFGVGDLRFGGATIDLDLEEGRRFGLETRATPIVTPKLPFLLKVAGAYSRGVSPFSIEALEAGRPGWMWRLVEPARVVFDDGQMILESFLLAARGERVSLDGTYRLTDGASFGDLLGRISPAPLRGLFDPAALRETLPAEYRRLLPEGVVESPEEAVRETIEETLREEIEERVPAFEPGELFDDL